MGLKDKLAKALAKRLDHPESEESLTQEKEELEREILDTYQAAERERSYRFHAQRGEEHFNTGRYVRSYFKERELNKERREMQERHKYVEQKLEQRRKEIASRKGRAQYDPPEEEEKEEAKPRATQKGKKKPIVERVIGGLNDVSRAVDAVYGDTPRRRSRGRSRVRRTTYSRGGRTYTRVAVDPFGGVDIGDPFGFSMGASMFDMGFGGGGGSGGGYAPAYGPTRVTISIGGSGGGNGRRRRSNDPFGFGQALDFGFGGRSPDRGILTL